ncbi:hypothetical protein Acr_15g0013320 [Actinidia rufa]|uniref:Uncharacterized protein n=1 Tax=Actinidia rufa TaxID=165716 RepID=A0A7J0FVW6_9ERIC|nr:hypothetical protein Acr_15g0013320 [Actinidia rufa]
MAAKQMEEIQKKLAMLNYPRANAPAQSLLFAGMERYTLLEWLFFKLLGDKSPFSLQNLQRDGMDHDEETARIQSREAHEEHASSKWLRLTHVEAPCARLTPQGAEAHTSNNIALKFSRDCKIFGGITTTIDTEAIQGRGSYEDRTEMLRLIVDLVEASIYADNPEWRL